MVLKLFAGVVGAVSTRLYAALPCATTNLALFAQEKETGSRFPATVTRDLVIGDIGIFAFPVSQKLHATF
jgi:hypothetical protein